jgi:hypothetical protein
MTGLAMLIRPRAPASAAKHLEHMLPYLASVPDDAFAMALLPAVASKLKRSPTLGEVRFAIEEAFDPPPFVAPSNTPSRLTPSWLAGLMGDTERMHADIAARDDDLRVEWGMTSAVRHAVEICAGDEKLLRVLRGLVGRWAPQNSDLIPPPTGPL